MSEKDHLYVETKTNHNSTIGAHFKGKISDAIDFYINRESFPAKDRSVMNMTITSSKTRTLFIE